MSKPIPGSAPPHTCPSCGFVGLTEPTRTAGGGGSYEICSSCDFEFGVTDDDSGFSYEQWRARWVAAGMPWSSAPYQPVPSDWDPARQLADLLASSGSSGQANFLDR